jgi:hypothetical protein
MNDISSTHQQVDTGLGFKCDKGILELILLMNKLPGIKTQFSCQGGDGAPPDNAMVLFVGAFVDLERFCSRLRTRLPVYFTDADGLVRYDHLSLDFQPDNIINDTNFGGIRGFIRFAPSEMERIVRTIKNLLEE